MKSYCVKQRKNTKCVAGSETYAMARKGRKMMKCKCAECGITETRFLKATAGKGLSLGKRSPLKIFHKWEPYLKRIFFK